MARRAKPAARRGRAAALKFPKVAAGELRTLLDFVRYATSRFIEAKLVFAHGTTDPVAEAEISRHAETAMSRWPLCGISIIHRVGRIAPGENIVLVLTASQHRQAAFEAAEFLMDYLKANAPFWKREEGAAGTSWIEAHDHDDAAAARWTKS